MLHDIGELLVARGEKVAVSETTAGGFISARMVSVARAGLGVRVDGLNRDAAFVHGRPVGAQGACVRW